MAMLKQPSVTHKWITEASLAPTPNFVTRAIEAASAALRNHLGSKRAAASCEICLEDFLQDQHSELWSRLGAESSHVEESHMCLAA